MSISYKYLINVNRYYFQVASIAAVGYLFGDYAIDTNQVPFSFAVYGVDAEEFAATLDYLMDRRDDNDAYSEVDEISLEADRASDTIRFVRDCGSVSITRGNLKVLFHGPIDRLRGLTKELRKANARYLVKMESNKGI